MRNQIPPGRSPSQRLCSTPRRCACEKTCLARWSATCCLHRGHILLASSEPALAQARSFLSSGAAADLPSRNLQLHNSTNWRIRSLGVRCFVNRPAGFTKPLTLRSSMAPDRTRSWTQVCGFAHVGACQAPNSHKCRPLHSSRSKSGRTQIFPCHASTLMFKSNAGGLDYSVACYSNSESSGLPA